MFHHSELVMLILGLTLDSRVHTGEIIGGHEAVAHSRPYMVLLERLMKNGEVKHCGGFLLNEDFVMSAAHCQEARSYTALLGVHSIHKKKEIQRIPVEQTFPRKDFNASNFKNDIMLLKLSSKAIFGENVKPIAIASQDDGSLPKSCSISGWGRTDEKISLMSAVLMEGTVTLVDMPQCAQDNLYCSEGEPGPGHGDSGGPLVCEDGRAYGVVSSTLKPKSGGPSINCYSKIPDYKGWINLIMTNAGTH